VHNRSAALVFAFTIAPGICTARCDVHDTPHRSRLGASAMPQIVSILFAGLVGTLVLAAALFVLGLFATDIVSIGAAITDASHERRDRPATTGHTGRMALHH